MSIQESSTTPRKSDSTSIIITSTQPIPSSASFPMERSDQDKVSPRTRSRVCVAICFTLEILVIFVWFAYAIRQTINGSGPDNTPYVYNNGAVASDTTICSQIGAQILEKGGSGVDSACATAFCLGVVSPFASGIGGGSYMIVMWGDQNAVEVIDFREVAPASAFKEMFYNDTSLSVLGGKAIGIPGEVKGLYYAQKKYGNLQWEEVLQPSIDLAQNGFVVSSFLEGHVNGLQPIINQPGFAALKALFTNPETNQTIKQGEIFTRVELANTLRLIQKYGDSVFYNGELTDVLVRDINAAGGNVSREDFANYALRIRDPVTFKYHDYEFVSMSPSSSGGSLLGLIFNILSNFAITSSSTTVEKYDNQTLHRIVEAFKFAFANRGSVGDPDFFQNMSYYVNQFIDPQTGYYFANNITDTTHPPDYYGRLKVPPSNHGTSHLSVMTRNQTVAMTTTVNLHFGSKVVSPLTGIIFNDEMNDFAVSNETNSFGLESFATNNVEPGKRPLSSMTPTIILRNSKPYITVGASGGPTIITTVAQVVLHLLEHQMSVSDAVNLPRIHHQHIPNYVEVEANFPDSLLAGLSERNHTIVRSNGTADGQITLGNCQVIMFDQDQFFAASDPRKGGTPAGY